MKFETRNDLQKFKDHPRLSKEESKKRNPLLILYDVDSSIIASELKILYNRILKTIFLQRKTTVFQDSRPDI
jgi:hypothetical protein